MKKTLFISISVLIIICAVCIYICIRRSHCDCVMCRYDLSTDVVYSEPDLYLIPGARSDLRSDYLDTIIKHCGMPPENLRGIKQVYD